MKEQKWFPPHPAEKNEEWLPSALGTVYISDQGRAYNGRLHRLLKPMAYNKRRNHLSITVTTNGARKTRSLAYLVAEAFVPIPEELKNKKVQVKHLDGDKRNNSAENLCWTKPNQGLTVRDNWSPVDIVSHLHIEGRTEEWKRFRDTQYFVSTFGRVFSLKSNKLRKHNKTKTGYLRISLPSVGNFFSHRLVAEVFHARHRTEKRNIVNHIDGVKTNNVAWNLEWVTHAENMAHAAAANLVPSGTDHPNAVLTNEQAAEARELYASGEYTFTSIAKELSCSRQSVARAVTGTTYPEAPSAASEPNDTSARAAKSEARKRQLAVTEAQRAVTKTMRNNFKKRSSADTLTASQVLAIRNALNTSTDQVVADKFELNLYTVMAIKAGRTYTWVKDENSVRPIPGPKSMQDKARHGLVDRNIVTADLIERVLDLRQEGMTQKQISAEIGFHVGTIKLIVGGRHKLQKDGKARSPKLSTDKYASRRGINHSKSKVTSDLIVEIYRDRFWKDLLPYQITKARDIASPTMQKILTGIHPQQQNDYVEMPDIWQQQNPAPPNSVETPERLLTDKDMVLMFSLSAGGLSPDSIARHIDHKGIGTQTVIKALAGQLTRQVRGELCKEALS